MIMPETLKSCAFKLFSIKEGIWKIKYTQRDTKYRNIIRTLNYMLSYELMSDITNYEKLYFPLPD